MNAPLAGGRRSRSFWKSRWSQARESLSPCLRRLGIELLEDRRLLSIGPDLLPLDAGDPLRDLIDDASLNADEGGFTGGAAHADDYFVDSFGNVVFVDPAPDPSRVLSEANGRPPAAEAAPFPLYDTFKLHSDPGASKVIYLDFDGHTTSGTGWNDDYGIIITPAYDFDWNPGFSDAEKERIQHIWGRVAEDYRPFHVDVTTEDPRVEALRKRGPFDSYWGVRMVIGGFSDEWYTGDAVGVAYKGSFNWDSDTPAFVFSEEYWGEEKGVAETISHEAGHTLGLSHDGYHDPSNPSEDTDYYEGHGSGETGWAPIMGSGDYRNLTQWSKGEYPHATNEEYDLSIITTENGFGYRSDDHGNTRSTATRLTISDGQAISGEGIIERNTDIDYFVFTTPAGLIDLSIDPFDRGPNLDVLATLYRSGGSVIATSNPTHHLEANFNLSLSVGTYYLSVDGTGKASELLDPGYSDYASLGYYTITWTVALPDTTPPTPNPSTWLTEPYATGTASIRMVATTASDPSGVQYYFDETTGNAGGSDSQWQDSPVYDDVGLSLNTTYTYQVKTRDQSANQNTGSYSVPRSATTPAAMEDFETGDFSEFPWEHSGDAYWTVTTTGKISGVYSARSGNITHSEDTTLSVTMTTDVGAISFWRRVSSESDYDYLEFHIDGSLKDRWSGSQSPAPQTYPVTAGSHTFTWTYDKDSMISSGSDAAWIDDIVFPPILVDTRPPEVTSIDPAPGATITTASVNIDVTFSEEVQGVDRTDLAPSGSPAGSAVVDVPADRGSNTWRFPVRNLVDGTLDVSLAPDPNDIEDLAGNDLANLTWSYTVSLDGEGSVEDFETGDFSKFPWTPSGDANWFITSAEQHGGAYSAQSGDITDYQDTTLEVDLFTDAGDISFWRRVSSESGYDYLEFYIDGSLKERWSGSQSWAQQTYAVAAGTHTFTWTYDKDVSYSSGSDAAWIDDIQFPISDVHGEIHGRKWNDLDGDGERDPGDPGEPGLPDWTIYLDLNENGVWDSAGTSEPVSVSSTDVPLDIIDDGTMTPVRSELIVSGVSGTLTDLDVTLDISHTWDADLHVYLISPSGTRVELFTEVGGDGDDFTDTTLSDEATIPITSGSAPFTGTYQPEGSLADLDEQDPNGTWKLEITDDLSLYSGTLNSWSITFTTTGEPEPYRETDQEGTYAFTDLAPGTYIVREELEPGWQQTAPALGYYVITLDAGEYVTGIDFGNLVELPPTVEQLLVRGSDWNETFLDHLDSQGTGHPTIPHLGCRVPDGSGQLDTLPWVNIDQLVIAFSEDLNVNQNDLSLRGVKVSEYAFSGFHYDPATFTATWTLSSPISPDKLWADLDGDPGGVTDKTGNLLDGEWTNTISTFPSGDGNPGGDFRFQFNVLPGDVNQSQSVTDDDLILVRDSLGTTPGVPGYSILNDVSADGMIIGNDLILVRNRLGTALPAPEPPIPARPLAAARWSMTAGAGLMTGAATAQSIAATVPIDTNAPERAAGAAAGTRSAIERQWPLAQSTVVAGMMADDRSSVPKTFGASNGWSGLPTEHARPTVPSSAEIAASSLWWSWDTRGPFRSPLTAAAVDRVLTGTPSRLGQADASSAVFAWRGDHSLPRPAARPSPAQRVRSEFWWARFDRLRDTSSSLQGNHRWEVADHHDQWDASLLEVSAELDSGAGRGPEGLVPHAEVTGQIPPIPGHFGA